MTTPDQARIEADRLKPRVLQLWWALRPLTSVVRFMNSGAHPDDETTAMLAALALRDGINLSYTCSTRGEGGQNDIGTETGGALGALRTREMERACDVLGMRMYWLSETPDDPITDFGFSKSGTETLAHWGHERTLARFVDVIRRDRPDILCPTFLDVPGQHGHHRAMTQAAHEVMDAAADPDFASNHPPWQVSKLYLPAWSGAGQSYDDAAPPPRATLVVKGDDIEPVSGWSWERIGQQSRAFHRTQGMGRWVRNDDHRDWPLHLARCHVPGPDISLTAGVPASVGALAEVAGPGPAADHLAQAQAALDRCLSAFPDAAAVADAAAQALQAVRAALRSCTAELAHRVGHRLATKDQQLCHVLRIALGVQAHGRSTDLWLRPGDSTFLDLTVSSGQATAAVAEPVLPDDISFQDKRVQVSASAKPTDGYRPDYDPLDLPAPALSVSLDYHGVTAASRVALDRPPVILPSPTAELSPAACLINIACDTGPRNVSLSGLSDAAAPALLSPDHGWGVTRTSEGFTLSPAPEVRPGLYEFGLTIGGVPALTARRVDFAHIDPTLSVHPATLKVRVLEVEVPKVRVGYIGSGHDQVDHWLQELGTNITPLGDPVLQSGDFSGFETLVIGIFALRFRPGLAEAMPAIHSWVEAGGTLLTLYHRPWDNWTPDTTPPRRLEIGQPSLRWRVTDEAAAVHHLIEHPVLSGPNPIGPQDWMGWVKERGLYFAKCWDDAYHPLLEMADAGETPHKGALLAADIGAGRHIHTSLILHHQMANLVPGAFRLMANLLATRA